MVHLREFHRRYQDRVNFLFVVIREANHVIPGLEFLRTVPNGPAPDPAERRRLVARAMRLKGVTVPAVLDAQDGSVALAYEAWPLRLIVVGKTGRVEYDVRYGRVADHLGEWLERYCGGLEIRP